MKAIDNSYEAKIVGGQEFMRSRITNKYDLPVVVKTRLEDRVVGLIAVFLCILITVSLG